MGKTKYKLTLYAVGIPLSVASAILVSLYVGGQSNATSILQTHGKEVERGISTLEVIRHDRGRYWQDSSPGNSTEYYVKAFSRFFALRPAVIELGRVGAIQDPIRPPEQAESLLDEVRPILTLLLQAQQTDRLEIRRDYLQYRQWKMELSYDEFGLFYRCFLRIADLLLAVHDGRETFIINQLLLGTAADFLYWTPLTYCNDDYEEQIIASFRRLLSSHHLSAEELRKATLFVGRIIKHRATMNDRLTAEDLSTRMAVLESEREKRDFFVWEKNAPWDYFFSPRLVRAAGLVQLSEAFSALKLVEQRPIGEWTDAAAAIVGEKPYRLVFQTIQEVPNHYAKEADRRTNLLLLQIALAIAWYQTETDQQPSSLDDLMPKYVIEVPREMKYQAGNLKLDNMKHTPWKVQRRP